ncbi:MAG: hypothetical protein R3280_14960 [Marinobacter sp.]|uniref:hypothetical protein n=1 Tax=Marinobacter sp. TaxID=50741 RepID=UPI00299DB6F9|nr:hypothetical protein [Marinobacter sp.]MDX1635936.1 hypothetical protein [Marinobacter sp.]
MMKTLLITLLLALMTPALVLAAPPGKDGDLPPGLQKKLERGERLPPGWQRKLEEGDRLPPDYDRYGEVYREDERYDRVEVDDRMFKVLRDTRVIVDILEDY